MLFDMRNILIETSSALPWFKIDDGPHESSRAMEPLAVGNSVVKKAIFDSESLIRVWIFAPGGARRGVVVPFPRENPGRLGQKIRKAVCQSCQISTDLEFECRSVHCTPERTKLCSSSRQCGRRCHGTQRDMRSLKEYRPLMQMWLI